MSKNDELCVENEKLCIENEELCIENEEFCASNDEFADLTVGTNQLVRLSSRFVSTIAAAFCYDLRLKMMDFTRKMMDFIQKMMDVLSGLGPRRFSFQPRHW